MPAVRSAGPRDLDALAQLWAEGWHDAHTGLVPDALIVARTDASFRERMAGYLPQVRTAGPEGSPLGFHMVKGDEVYQVFVSRAARGTGLAIRLMQDAELQLRAAGVSRPWIACVVGNERAARFYEKAGWVCDRSDVTSYDVESTVGPVAVRIWRFEKTLAP